MLFKHVVLMRSGQGRAGQGVWVAAGRAGGHGFIDHDLHSCCLTPQQSISMPDICKAAVATTAFADQRVFKE
jgi:hypothetical protein